jgi:hypothetical protein
VTWKQTLYLDAKLFEFFNDTYSVILIFGAHVAPKRGCIRYVLLSPNRPLHIAFFHIYVTAKSSHDIYQNFEELDSARMHENNIIP